MGKLLSKASELAYISWKWCFSLELIFSNIVSVTMICCFRLLKEMWSHGKNSDISMTFSDERERNCSLSFFFHPMPSNRWNKKGKVSLLPADSIPWVATVHDIPQCLFVCSCFLKCLVAPCYPQLRIHHGDTNAITLLKFGTFLINMLYIRDFYSPWDFLILFSLLTVKLFANFPFSSFSFWHI